MKAVNRAVRLDYISIFKFIAITLVVIGHIPNIDPEIKRFIYSFHMPLFFMIYGFIKKSTVKEGSFLVQANGKVKTIVVPYLIWGLIYSGIGAREIKNIIWGSHASIKETSNSSLWFLPTYFLAVIIFDLYSRALRKMSGRAKIAFEAMIIGLTIIATLLLPRNDAGYIWGCDVSICGFTLMIIGKHIRFIYDMIKSKKKKTLGVCLILVSVTMLLLYRFNKIDYVLMAENNYGNFVNFMVVSMGGFGALLGVSVLLDRIMIAFLKKYMVFVGDNTLVLLAAQRIVIRIFDSGLTKINMPNNGIRWAAVATLSLITLSALVSAINKYAPILNGKTYNPASAKDDKSAVR